eukprot:1155807-Pelagomonas_calceolata.AAC.8
MLLRQVCQHGGSALHIACALGGQTYDLRLENIVPQTITACAYVGIRKNKGATCTKFMNASLLLQCGSKKSPSFVLAPMDGCASLWSLDQLDHNTLLQSRFGDARL